MNTVWETIAVFLERVFESDAFIAILVALIGYVGVVVSTRAATRSERVQARKAELRECYSNLCLKYAALIADSNPSAQVEMECAFRSVEIVCPPEMLPVCKDFYEKVNHFTTNSLSPKGEYSKIMGAAYHRFVERARADLDALESASLPFWKRWFRSCRSSGNNADDHKK